MLKGTEEKQQITYKGIPHRVITDFLTNSAGQKGVA